MPEQALHPISFSSFDQYRQVMRKIYKTQKMEGVLTAHWDNIWTQACDDLSTQVKTRGAFVKKATHTRRRSMQSLRRTPVSRNTLILNRNSGMMQLKQRALVRLYAN